MTLFTELQCLQKDKQNNVMTHEYQPLVDTKHLRFGEFHQKHRVAFQKVQKAGPFLVELQKYIYYIYGWESSSMK